MSSTSSQKSGSNSSSTTTKFPLDELIEGCHPGQLVPDFKCPATINGTCQMVGPAAFKGSPLLVVFYPVDFDYIAPSELIALDTLRGPRKVIAVSSGSLAVKNAWLATPTFDRGIKGVEIPLVQDMNMALSKRFGMIRLMSGYSFRGYAVVNSEGLIVARYMNDLPIGIGVCEALRLYDGADTGVEAEDMFPGQANQSLFKRLFTGNIFSSGSSKGGSIHNGSTASWEQQQQLQDRRSFRNSQQLSQHSARSALMPANTNSRRGRAVGMAGRVPSSGRSPSAGASIAAGMDPRYRRVSSSQERRSL